MEMTGVGSRALAQSARCGQEDLHAEEFGVAFRGGQQHLASGGKRAPACRQNGRQLPQG